MGLELRNRLIVSVLQSQSIQFLAGIPRRFVHPRKIFFFGGHSNNLLLCTHEHYEIVIFLLFLHEQACLSQSIINHAIIWNLFFLLCFGWSDCLSDLHGWLKWHCCFWTEYNLQYIDLLLIDITRLHEETIFALLRSLQCLVKGVYEVWNL